MRIIKELLKLNLFKTLFYNFFSRHIKRGPGSWFLVYKHAKIRFYKNSLIKLDRKSLLKIGYNPGIDGYGTTSVIMCKNSKWDNSNNTLVNLGSSIVVHQNGALITNNNSINHSCCIKCKQFISLGFKTVLGRGTQIMDSDFHLFEIDGQKKNSTSSVKIGNKVWIGTNCIILKGATIGDNCIVGAGTLVNKEIPNNSVAYSKSTLTWSHHDDLNWS